MKKSKAMIDQIRRLKEAGHPIRKIAASLGVSRNTVRRYLRAESEEIPAGAEGAESDRSSVPEWRSRLPWEQICQARRRGVAVKQLFEEYQPAVSYSRFCRALKKEMTPTVAAALRLTHLPGERTQIDFCTGLKITDPRTGEEKKTHLFCGVLPFSSLTYAEFVPSQQIAPFIRCHENMWAYFGGVSKYAVIDNLKSGVTKAHRYDPDVNPTYVDYGNHAGFAVLPARPYTPRDKAAVEAAIGVIQKTFYQKYRDHKFYSLAELNTHLRHFLDELNSQPMRETGVSRRERFAEESPALLPLPSEPYEIVEWRTAKVHPDCCIQVQKCFYSVPFRYVGQRVRVKLSARLVEIYSQDAERLACHVRSHRQGDPVIDEAHLPPTRMQESSFEIRKVKAQAASIGEKTRELVEQQLSGDRPLRHLRRVQGILRLLDQGIPRESLEYAASQALTYRKYRVAYIKSCAEFHKANGGGPRLAAPVRDPDTIHLHGG